METLIGTWHTNNPVPIVSCRTTAGMMNPRECPQSDRKPANNDILRRSTYNVLDMGPFTLESGSVELP